MKRTGTIAFCGSKGAGKSTSATLFKNLINVPTEELAIAEHLKNVCSKVFNLDIDLFLNPALKEVELEEFIVLDTLRLTQLLEAFYVTEIDELIHVRPHIGKVIHTPRYLLQYIGSEVLHKIDPLIHVKMVTKKKDPTKLTIITDLRFVAEFEHLKSLDNFLPVYVKNTSAENRASSDAHSSERQVELFRNSCYQLYNEGTMETLITNLHSLIDEVYDDKA